MRYGVTMLASAAILIAAAPPGDDPHRNLEQVDAPDVLAIVKGWNARSLATLEAQPNFQSYRTRAEALLSDDRKIATPDQVVGTTILNFWQDADHPRGLWRASRLDRVRVGQAANGER